MFRKLLKKRKLLTEFKKSSVATRNPDPELADRIETDTADLPLDFLKQLVPVCYLSSEKLRQLSIYSAVFRSGSIIFNQGSRNDCLIYLFTGIVYLEASNGTGQEITENTLQAYYPLSNGPEHLLTAIAKSETTVIYIAQSDIPRNKNKINPLICDSFIPEQLENNTFFTLFSYHFKQDKLEIPSIPDIALKLHTAIQKNVGTGEAAKIISLDPVITSKLIHFTNSPLYRTINPTSSCLDAVNRLGIATTRNIVTSLSMHSLFRSNKKSFNTRIQNLWKESIRISSISHALAVLTQKADPEEALLAGLLHNLGSLPILKFAEKLSDDAYQPEELDQCLLLIQGHLGSWVLEQWGFSNGLARIPSDVEDWYYDSGKSLILSDIVLLAKFHSLIGTHKAATLPLISTLPAYQKFGNKTLSPNMSLQILQDAKQQISDTINLFVS
jgi:HD-like signal output (HDOD) protein